MSKQKTLKGFTLIEILVVVALIAILTAITFIAINPAKNFADTRNAQRSSDVVQILNAVTQYTSEQGNSLTTLVAGGTAIPSCVGDATASPAYGALPIGTGAGNVNLTGTGINRLVPDFIVGIPTDPQIIGGTAGTAANTGYTICTTSGSRVRITAPNTENVSATKLMISVLR